MATESAVDVARALVAAINRHDADAIAELLTEDHLSIDTGGGEEVGVERMREAWAGYFRMVPDYHVRIDEALSAGEVVVLLGRAEGGYVPVAGEPSPGHWETPAVWRAVIRGEQVAEWRIYADLEPIRRLMGGDD